MAKPTSKERVSLGCISRMGLKRESLYGEYNNNRLEENMKPVPVVQILRWQGTRQEWVVIDLVPETSEPCLASDKMSPSKKTYQEKTKLSAKETNSSEPCITDNQMSHSKKAVQEKLKNSCKKSEEILSEPCTADNKMPPSKKTHQEQMKKSEEISSKFSQSEKMTKKTHQEKEVVKNIKTCFCFGWKEKSVTKYIKKVNDNEECIKTASDDNKNTIVEEKNDSGDQRSKQSKIEDISKDQISLSNEEPTRAFENIPMSSPKISQIFGKTNNKNSNISFNPDSHQECRIAKRNSNRTGNHSKNVETNPDSSKPINGTFCKASTRDAEAEKVLRAAILVTEATIKTVQEMKAPTKKCDIVVKTMGYKADLSNVQRPVWKTASPNTKFKMSKQVDNNNPKTSGKGGKIEEPVKNSRQRETEKSLKRSEAKKEYILGLLNNLIYEVVAKKKAAIEEEALDDKSLKETFGNDELLFADEEKENEEPAEKEKSAVDYAKKTLKEVNGFQTSRSWY